VIRADSTLVVRRLPARPPAKEPFR
jgi:hypothetical protein